ncbi:MAG: GNAT family N-acetyltransferase [Thermoplasmata archaeon]
MRELPRRPRASVASEAMVQPGIDRDWLDRAFAAEPLTHAFAVWDLDAHPHRIRFLSCRDLSGTTLAYLLFWQGNPALPVVHWVGDDYRARCLTPHLPSPPAVAIVPEARAAEAQEALRAPRAAPILGQIRDGKSRQLPEPDSRIRRLRPGDSEALVRWAARQNDPIVSGYATVDLASDQVWGAFDGGELLGIARAQVRLPTLWVLGGVYVAPEARHRGLGLGLTAAGIQAAYAARARVGLWVREDNFEARDLYDALGFRTVERRVWIEAPALS